MDAQILTATLATLAAVFAGLNGGAFTVDDIQNNTEIPDMQNSQQEGLTSMLPDIPLLDRLTQKPEPENPVKAQIKLQDNPQLKLSKASLTAKQLTQIKSNRIKIDSDQEITLHKYTGQIQFAKNTSIKGTSQGANTSGVNITTPIKIQTQTTANQINIENTQKTPIKSSNASIQPTPDSDFGINTENTDLNINSFTGNITVHTKNKTLIIDGKVDKLKAGQYQIQTQ